MRRLHRNGGRLLAALFVYAMGIRIPSTDPVRKQVYEFTK